MKNVEEMSVGGCKSSYLKAFILQKIYKYRNDYVYHKCINTQTSLNENPRDRQKSQTQRIFFLRSGDTRLYHQLLRAIMLYFLRSEALVVDYDNLMIKARISYFGHIFNPFFRVLTYAGTENTPKNRVE